MSEEEEHDFVINEDDQLDQQSGQEESDSSSASDGNEEDNEEADEVRSLSDDGKRNEGSEEERDSGERDEDEKEEEDGEEQDKGEVKVKASSDSEAESWPEEKKSEKNENESEQEEASEKSEKEEREEGEEKPAEEKGEGVAGEEAAEAPKDEEAEANEEEVVQETVFDVEIPRIVADLGKETHFVKLPNFLSVETHPFDPQWYEDEIDEDEMLDEEGRSRLKLKVENTIRWRNAIDKESGEMKKESNALMVRWSDGSHSLHLGNEIFDVHKLQMMANDNNHLFIRQGTGLLGQAVFKTKLSFRPYSTESFTHRKLTLSLADRSQKTQKIRVLPNVGKDPEAHRSEMIKKEEDRLKASIRRENKMRRVREGAMRRGPTASYLEPDQEEEDEEDGISIAKIKNQYKRPHMYNRVGYDESDSGEEPKVGPAAGDDDDSDLDIFDKRKSTGETKVRKIESDEED